MGSFEERVEAVTKAVTSAIANKHGYDLAGKLIPTVTEAVAQALAAYASEEELTQRDPYAKASNSIVRAGRILGSLGMMAGSSGNISVRLDDGTVLITPSGVRKGDLQSQQLVHVDLSGHMLSDGNYKMSSEYMIHLQAYKSRSDVRAVVHTHPPFATTFAAAHQPLDNTVLAEAWNTMGGSVPVVPFGAPSTPELAENLIPYIKNHNCFLLANHGLMVVGRTLEEAVQVTETVEFLAKVQLQSRLIGGENPLRGQDIRILESLQAKRSGH